MKVAFNNFTELYASQQTEYLAACKRVLDSGWFVLGQEVKSFEEEFAAYCGVTHCIGVANGLEALQIALVVLDIGPGDEVITTPLSAVATTLAITAVGAQPVFVDTNDHGLIEVQAVAAAITTKTKAVLPVHLYGNPVEVQALQALCEEKKIYLIEDAAQAHGAEYAGKKLGSFGVLNCFSFYPTKNLGAVGDGGAITTNSLELAEKCKVLRDYGQKKKYYHTEFGLNSRLDELQAAFLRIRLRNLEKENTRRRTIATQYREQLNDLDQLSWISPTAGGNGHLCVLKTADRDQLQAALQAAGIEALVHYPLTIPDQPVYAGDFSGVQVPQARAVCQEVLSLPCHPTLSDAQVSYVAGCIRKFFESR